MRSVGAVLFGIWYSLVLSSGFSDAIRILSSESDTSAFGKHYLLTAATWFIGVGLAALLAGLASRTHPLAVSILSSTPAPLLYAWVFLSVGANWLDYQLEPLIFGWSPNAVGFAFVVCVLTLAVGTSAGLMARTMLDKEDDDESASDPSGGFLGIRWGHWLWLWIPIWSWSYLMGLALYVGWLALATGWHWAFHPSLWFNWKWLLFGTFGIGFTVLPITLLGEGIGNALETMEIRNTLTLSRWGKIFRFLGYGYGMAVFGTMLSLQLAFWILSHLPLVAGKELPWWILD